MRLIAFVICSLVAVQCIAQEGHPLRGTWHGTWGPNAQTRNDVTLVMDWIGALSGIVNPGLRAAKMEKMALDAPTFGLHFEADVKDRAGNVSHVVADGKIQDVTNARRSIVGTWKQGEVTGDFKVTRDE